MLADAAANQPGDQRKYSHAAETNALVPVSRVGCRTGANFGLWFGMLTPSGALPSSQKQYGVPKASASTEKSSEAVSGSMRCTFFSPAGSRGGCNG